MKRKIILNLATSLDGYICDENGGFDWIVGDGDKSHDTKKQFNFEEFTNTIDTIVMGKTAFEDSVKKTMESFSDKTIYVVSNELIKTKYENIKIISGDIVSQIQKIQKQKGKHIWIYGGAVMADYFIKANVIDEYIIGIIPKVIGKGRKLFLENNPKINLHLIENTVQEGVVILKYEKLQIK
jgi:dihydrofolate reductase